MLINTLLGLSFDHNKAKGLVKIDFIDPLGKISVNLTIGEHSFAIYVAGFFPHPLERLCLDYP